MNDMPAASTSPAAAAPVAVVRVRVWDLPTRLFHWALAALVVFSIASAYIGGNAMAWHFRSGYAVLTLLAFRLLWGVVGGHWSRFTSFIYLPPAMLRYLRGRELPTDHFDVGHSPSGSLSVFALLTVLAAQVGSGLVADDEIAERGPLVRFVSESISLQLTNYHQNIGQWLLVGLVVLHIAAIVFYLVARKRNLVAAMLHGDKLLPPHVVAAGDNASTRLLAAVLLAACAGGVYWLVSLGG